MGELSVRLRELIVPRLNEVLVHPRKVVVCLIEVVVHLNEVIVRLKVVVHSKKATAHLGEVISRLQQVVGRLKNLLVGLRETAFHLDLAGVESGAWHHSNTWQCSLPRYQCVAGCRNLVSGFRCSKG